MVLHLQQTIKKAFQESDPELTQIVIYGKIGHAEVNGLVGQTNGSAIVIEGPDDLNKVDFNKNIKLFSQTTKSIDGFKAVVDLIKERIKPGCDFQFNDTICRQALSW